MLLKNDGILPLVPGSRVALFGSGAGRTIKGGTGSGDVNEREVVSIYQGLVNAGFDVTSQAWIEEFEETYRKSARTGETLFLRRLREKTGRNFSRFTLLMLMRCLRGAPFWPATARAPGQLFMW